MNLYLKVFLHTGPPYGLTMGALAGLFVGATSTLNEGVRVALLVSILAGLLFGGASSLILVSIHRWKVKIIATTDSPVDLGVHHDASIELQLPFDEAFDLCLESLRVIDANKVRKEDRAHGMIEAKTSVNRKTFGDIVSLVVSKLDDYNALVEVSSQPAVPTTLLDYGKNLGNVQQILRFLESRSNKKTSETADELK